MCLPHQTGFRRLGPRALSAGHCTPCACYQVWHTEWMNKWTRNQSRKKSSQQLTARAGIQTQVYWKPGPYPSLQELAGKGLPASDTRGSYDGLAALESHHCSLCFDQMIVFLWSRSYPECVTSCDSPFPDHAAWGKSLSSVGTVSRPRELGLLAKLSHTHAVLTNYSYVWCGVWQWGRDSCTFYSTYYSSIWISFTMSVLEKNIF